MAYDAWMFIQDHPAFIGNQPGLSSFYFFLLKLCKNGLAKESFVYVYKDNPRFIEFVDVEDHIIGYTRVDYKNYYGYPWEFHEIVYFFEGGPNKWSEDAKEWINQFHDTRLDVDGITYEEALINLAERVKQFYGDWSVEEDVHNTIIPKHILENNKSKEMFLTKCDQDEFSLPFKRNADYIVLSEQEISQLWWDIYGGEFV
jgi:hypothetical protein